MIVSDNTSIDAKSFGVKTFRCRIENTFRFDLANLHKPASVPKQFSATCFVFSRLKAALSVRGTVINNPEDWFCRATGLLSHHIGHRAIERCNASRQKELIEVLELNIQPDYIHLTLSVPTKYSISRVVEYLKGKLALKIFERYERLGKRYWGWHLWSRGYCVSTIGLNEEEIRKYVKWQEKKEMETEQGQLGL